MANGPVLVVDFGAQYAQLIARRVREAGVYSELVPHSMPVDEILAKDPKAIILSGGPASVFEPGAPTLDTKVFESGVPVLGICYGFQVMAYELGGKVDKAALGEYGKTSATIDDAAGILADSPAEQTYLKVQASYIGLLVLTKNILETCIDVLGFSAPDRM